MKCQVCQADLSAGSTFCTNCGTPVPSNPYGSPASASSPNQGIAPTMLASSAPSPDPYGQPPQPSPYGQPPANPYGVPPTAYGSDTPTPNPYGAPPPNPYGTPPPANPYGVPSQQPYGTPGAYGQPQYVPQQPQKKGPNGCVIAVVIVLVVLVLIGGGIVALVATAANKVSQGISSINATATADMATANSFLTPTVGNNGTTPTVPAAGGVPSASQIDPNAQANVFHAKTSTTVDSNYKPTHITSSFTIGDTIYITYDLSGKAGYIIEKTYDTTTGTIVIQSQSPHTIDANDSNGYISFDASLSGNYTTGLYWCSKSDCSDAGLAQVVSFTVA